ncbi:MAG: heme ABC transporter permease [Alphaproteobacteria bacterium]|nr:heme ABC transporter permease [Alphaproteobacteria bacterium]
MSYLANPGRFTRFADRVLPWLSLVAVVAFILGLYYALYASPPDYQQGETVRIMYIHVPAAWFGMAIYAAMAMAAGIGLVLRHALADLFCVAAAPVGAALVALCLITGSIWGQPTWGTWWVWDARLTSVLILFFLYLGYMALRHAFEDDARGAKAGAILLLVGVVNLPIIKFSVEWWNTLHQPASVLRLDGPTIHPSMLTPLLIMALAYGCFCAVLVMLRLKTILLRRKNALI